MEMEQENCKFTERHSVSLSPRFWPDGPFCSDGMGTALPKHTQWLRDIMHHLTLQEIRFSLLKGSQDEFYKTLQPFLTHFQVFHTI